MALPGEVRTAFALAALDLDGDGDMDLIEGTGGQDEVLENQGGGAFVVGGVLPPPAGSPQADTRALATGDVDGDGDPDVLATWSAGGPAVRLFANQGGLSFAEVTATAIPALPSASLPSAAVLGDVDGDGDLDAYLGNQAFSEWHTLLLLGDGSGSFTDGTAQLPSDTSPIGDVAFGDVDSDGDLDALLATGNYFPLSPPQANLLQRNDGKGVFTGDSLALPALPADSKAAALRDLDGDGDLDALFANDGPAANHLLLNDGSGVFADASTQLPSSLLSSVGLVLADLDGDLDPDVVFGEEESVADTLLFNDGAGAFQGWPASSGLPPSAGRTEDLGVADFDGDGRVDLLVGRPLGSTPVLQLLLGDPLGNFADASTGVPPVVSACRGLALGDVDGDGDADSYVSQNNPGQDVLLRNAGGGDFEDASAGLPTTAPSSAQVALGDLDGDGDLDAFLGVNHGNERVLRGDGAGHFTYVSSAVPADEGITSDVELVDVDGDGDLDSLVARSTGAPCSLYLNDGKARFAYGGGALVGNSREVEAGDVDGDGDPDVLLSGNPYSVPMQLYLNSGSGLFSDASSQLHSTKSAFELDLADADDDGDLDVFTGDRLYANDGSGDFSVVSHMLPDTPPWQYGVPCAARLADLDGDGDADAYVGTQDEELLWFGLVRHLAWRYVPRIGQPLDMDVWGPPLEAFSMGWALGPGVVSLPPLGTLFLDPFTLHHAASGVLGADGRGTVTFPVPQDPGLVGVDVLWQAAVGDAFVRLTNLERTTPVAL
jgi:hypothetical protein